MAQERQVGCFLIYGQLHQIAMSHCLSFCLAMWQLNRLLIIDWLILLVMPIRMEQRQPCQIWIQLIFSFQEIVERLSQEYIQLMAQIYVPSNLFKNVSLLLSAYNGQEVIIKIEGKWSTGDYYIDFDNINITLPSPNDAGIQTLLSPTPTFGCPSATTSVKVRIKNYGNNNISNVPVRVTINGPIPAVLSATYTGTIAPASTFDFVVGNADLSAPGTYTITARTIYPADPNSSNDSFLLSNECYNCFATRI